MTMDAARSRLCVVLLQDDDALGAPGQVHGPLRERPLVSPVDPVETAAEVINFCNGLLRRASPLRDLCARAPVAQPQ